MALTLECRSVSDGDVVVPDADYGCTDDLVELLDLKTTIHSLLRSYVLEMPQTLTSTQQLQRRGQLTGNLHRAQKAVRGTKATLDGLKRGAAAGKRRGLERRLRDEDAKVKQISQELAAIPKDAGATWRRGRTLFASFEAQGPGTLITLKFASGEQVPGVWDIVVSLLEVIDELLQRDYYTVLSNGNAIPGEDGTPVLERMFRLSLFDCLAIAKGQRLKAQQMGLIAEGNLNDPDNRRFVHVNEKQPASLWVPNALPLLLYDSARRSECYVPQQDGTFAREPVRIGRIGCYRVEPAEPGKVKLTEFDPQLPGAGRTGGSGAMRADRVTEVEYRWQGDETLGLALGLDPALRRPPGRGEGFVQSPTPTAPARARHPVTGGMDAAITYYRKFLDPCPDKKNKPKDTFPLLPPAYQQTDESKRYYSATGMTKKRKGEWQLCISGPARGGEPLKNRGRSDRLDASAVMKEAFKRLDLAYSSSATAFAAAVIATGEAADDWKGLSSGLLARPVPAKPATDAQKAALRTDQEWCHLYGHGDGGDETLENFVAGSNHCNTEQLAIELAQRADPGAATPPELTAKITAYLFPGQRVPKLVLENSDHAFLRLCDRDTFPEDASDAEQIRTAALFLADQNPRTFTELLPSADGGALPSKQYYNDHPGEQDGVRKRVLGRLRHVTTLPLPLARVIRYKLYVKQDGRPVKIFDHSFWAQKESFDLNEFQILNTTVRRVIADATDTRALYDARIQMKADLATANI